MRALLAAMLLAASGAVFAQASEIDNPDPVVEERLKGLSEELRCLVCQNQTIADSNAPLAVDLRQQIRGQIAEGRSDDQIRSYMVDRYGDFVLYRPPFKASTAILWGGPLLLVLLGIAIFLRVVRRRPAPAAPGDVPEAGARRARIEALLEGEDAPAAPAAPAAPVTGGPAKGKRPRRGRS